MSTITWTATEDGARSACGLFGVYLIPEGHVGIAWLGGEKDFSQPYPTLGEAQRWCERQLLPVEAA